MRGDNLSEVGGLLTFGPWSSEGTILKTMLFSRSRVYSQRSVKPNRIQTIEKETYGPNKRRVWIHDETIRSLKAISSLYE